ncbi:MAG TPA: phosphoribosylamine--glycine ligase, partial [Terriglobia bacterium]|nr:phosphoribosylamine--glycine ligase [Terriglobia bacterium]
GDAFRTRRLAVVEPSQIAAQVEGSKIFSKDFLLRHKIPTARLYGTFDVAAEAGRALAEVRWPVVLKADGLCAGKGVLVATDADEALDFIERVMEKDELGPGGRKILIEEAVTGEELSFLLLTDGEHYAPLVPTRDHKRAFDGNRGPNTGGMGAYSTDDLLSPQLRAVIESRVVEPTLRGLVDDGIRYSGFLYIGLMLTAEGPKVLEFNCRLGDPEAQAILARADFDVAAVLSDVAGKRFNPDNLRWKSGASVCVVLASGGYPGKFEAGKKIDGLTGLEAMTGVKVLHAGTRRLDGSFLTSGGRVLGVTAAGEDLENALAVAYRAAKQIHFDGMFYRHDIGVQSGRAHSAGD